MTQQDDITQRGLTAEHHLNELMRLTQPWPSATIPCATVRSHVEQALSKLRAPVANERTAFDAVSGLEPPCASRRGNHFREGYLEARADALRVLGSLASAPVADERAAVDPCGYVAVKVSAVDWLKDKFPALTIKAGLCERIGGRLYTITRLMRDHDAALGCAPVAVDRQRLRNLVDVVWNEATESTAVPDTPWADRLIDKVFPSLAASAPVAGEAQPTDGDILALANRYSARLRTDNMIAFARALLSRYAAPQASAEGVRNAALEEAYEAVACLYAAYYQHSKRSESDDILQALKQVGDDIRALKQPQADKDGCTCPSGDGSLRHPCPMHPGADKDVGQQRAGDVDVGRLMTAAKGMTRLYSYVWDRTDGCLVVFPENVRAFDAAFDALRMATGEAVDDAAQAEQGERDAD